jgi:putative MATE family efflux protein
MQSGTKATTAPTFWQSVREALRGSHQDYTKGNLNRSILLLAIPMVLEMVLESLFAVVDVFWVSRLGADAIATVGLTESVLTLVFAVGMGLGMSTTAMVARRIGEKDPDGAAVSAVQAIFLGLIASVVIGLPFFLLAPRLLGLMGATPAIIAGGANYTRIALGGSGVVLLLFLNNAIFRGAGDAAIAMRLLWVSNILNLIFDPCLIFGLGPFPKLGVTGAALATFSGRGIGVLYQFYRLGKGTERIRILGRHMRLQGAVLWRLIRVSITGILQFLISQASWIGLVRIVSLFGAPALAAYTIGIRIVIFAILPSWGLSNAAATLVGQNLGAGHVDRARKAVWRTGLWNMAFPRLRRHSLYPLCALDHRPVHAGSCGDRNRHPVSAHLQLRQHCLRLRHGDAAGVQRGGRHAHSHLRESLRLLGSGDSACLVARHAHLDAGERRLYLCRRCAIHHRAHQHRSLPSGPLGEAAHISDRPRDRRVARRCPVPK